jgi:hypothetical protein
MPARTPVTTGVERNSAIQPRRAKPTPITTMPIIKASTAVRAIDREVPTAARVATVAAIAGAMVESAPTDIWGLCPKMAKTTDPAMNAYRPVIAGMLASLAVAI